MVVANPSSAEVDAHTRQSLGDISRPEALAEEPREVPAIISPPAATGTVRR